MSCVESRRLTLGGNGGGIWLYGWVFGTFTCGDIGMGPNIVSLFNDVDVLSLLFIVFCNFGLGGYCVGGWSWSVESFGISKYDLKGKNVSIIITIYNILYLF